MVLVKFDSKKEGDKDMHGLTFDLDTRMLEEDFKVTRAYAYSAIEQALEERGFVHAQYSVYILPESKSSMSFVLMVRKLFARFRYAEAVRDLQCFEVKEWSTLTDEIHEGNVAEVALGSPLWPPER